MTVSYTHLPTATPAAQFGFLPLITGTLWVSLFAILFALPFGLSVSIYMSEVANPKVRNWLKPIIELLSGIPSVVYGFFGLIVIVPLIQKLFNLPVGESGLAGSIVLAIMALPTIITVTEDATVSYTHLIVANRTTRQLFILSSAIAFHAAGGTTASEGKGIKELSIAIKIVTTQ